MTMKAPVTESHYTASGDAHAMPNGHPWPTVSVVTPNYNYGHFIEHTIRSVLGQQYPNLEYIVIDDGSTDGSVQIIQQYAQQLTYWEHQTNQGQYAAINTGFSHSHGEIMAWLNSDDMYLPWALKTVASIFDAFPQIEWLTTLAPALWDWSGFCLGMNPMPGYSREAFLDGGYVPWGNRWLGWIQQESTFWRRSLWDNAGSAVTTEFSQAGDFDLWARFYAHAELYGTSCPLGGIRCQQHQRSRQRVHYTHEAEASLTRMRQRCHWSPNALRQSVLRSRLHRVPILKRLFQARYMYVGKTVVRRQPESPDGFWDIEEYRFFYP